MPVPARPDGWRFYRVEGQHYRDDYFDDSNENGLLLQWQRETLDLGYLSLAATCVLVVNQFLCATQRAVSLPCASAALHRKDPKA